MEGRALRAAEVGFRAELAEASSLAQLASAFSRRVDALAEGIPRLALADRGARLDRAFELVRQSPSSNLTRARVAKECGMSPSYFSRLFAARHGVGFERFVIQSRLDEAKRLLRSTEHPVRRIAVASGFSSYAHLAKAFRREEGTTPRDFRRSDRD
jgi:transcriptional regulator GlxA family with amidase domain